MSSIPSGAPTGRPIPPPPPPPGAAIRTERDEIPAHPLGALFSPYTWLATTHFLAGPILASIGFTIVVTGLALSLSLMPVALLGVPCWYVTVGATNWLSAIERARLQLAFGTPIPRPIWPRRKGFLRYAHVLATSKQVWREIAFQLVSLPVSIALMCAALVIWSVPLAMITLPAYIVALPDHHADMWLFTITNPAWAAIPAVFGLLVLVLVTPQAIRGLSALTVAYTRALLGPDRNAQLQERVDELQHTRRRAVDAAEAERRRIERDLHDGAQQRLTALAMTLGRAKVRLGDEDDPAVRALIEEAHREAKEAITELRNLTRGIHPPVLTDRGLDAALSALAARSPVPVTVEVDVGARPSPTIEAIAYFVVAETLTNIARHASADRASVVVRRTDGHLRLVVSDDGIGGADPAVGTGLSGLADRVASVDGTLTVASPLGQGTTITVELPCE